MPNDEMIHWTEDLLEAKIHSWYLVGERASLDTLVKFLSNYAGELFSNGKDEKARWLRDEIVKLIEEKSKAIHIEEAEHKAAMKKEWPDN